MSTDMPWPKEEPVGENPPEGAPINYYLKNDASVVSLEIVDARGRVVRRYASTDSLPYAIPTDATAPVPRYWYRVPAKLSSVAGAHRWYWDVHYQNLPAVGGGGFGFGGGGGGGGGAGLPISAIAGNTAPASRAPWAAAGNYTVRLTVDGKTYTQPITVKQDPRVKTAAATMRDVYSLTDSLYFTQKALQSASDSARAALSRSANDSTNAKRITAVLDAPDPKAPAPANPNAPRPAAPGTIRAALTTVSGFTNSLQAADVAPTANQRSAIEAALRDANAALGKWAVLKAKLPRT
jgi:hypothetical protein